VYAASVLFADRRVGHVLEVLEERGLLDSHALVITSDHGEELWDHGDVGHGRSLFADNVHVPLLIRPPGGAEARTVARYVELIDLHPTALELLGLEAPRGPWQAGESLLLWMDGSAGPGGRAYSELRTRGLAALRGSEWSVLATLDEHGEAGRTTSYDLAQDPGELRALPDTDPRSTESRAAFLSQHRELQALRARIPDPAAETTLSPDLLERLRAAGYLDD
jgi:uncharacterized sulfatase